MPDIALMRRLWSHRGRGVLNGFASIADQGLPVHALLVHLPQEQRPAVSIHCHRTGAGPNSSTLHVHYVEIGLSTLAAIQFVQSQCPQGRRGMPTHPLLRSLPCHLDDAGNLAPTSMQPQQALQTALDAAIAGVSFQKPRQDRSLQLVRTVGCAWGNGAKRCLQSRLPLRFPPVERLACDAKLLTQPTDGPIGATVPQQPTDPLCVLVGCARMSLDHWFLPGGDGNDNVLYPPYLPGTFLATAASHTVTSLS